MNLGGNASFGQCSANADEPYFVLATHSNLAGFDQSMKIRKVVSFRLTTIYVGRIFLIGLEGNKRTFFQSNTIGMNAMPHQSAKTDVVPLVRARIVAWSDNSKVQLNRPAGPLGILLSTPRVVFDENSNAFYSGTPDGLKRTWGLFKFFPTMFLPF